MQKVKGYLLICLLGIGLIGCTTKNVDQPRNLEITLFDNNQILQEVVNKYIIDQKVNNMEYQLNLSEKQIVGNEESIQQLSAQIISGDAPDILDLAALPYEKYAEKGALQGFEKEVFSELLPEYDIGISRAMMEDDKIYAIPLTIQVPAIGINREIMSKMGGSLEHKQYPVDEFLDLLQEINKNKPENTYLLPKDASDYMLAHMLKLYYYTYTSYPEDKRKEEIAKILANVDDIRALEHPEFNMWDVLQNKKGEKEQVVFLPTIVERYNAVTEDYDYIPMITLEQEINTLYTTEILGVSVQEGFVREKQEEFIKYAFSEKLQYDIGFPGRVLVANEKSRQSLITFHLEKYPELKSTIDVIESMIKKTDLVIGQELDLNKVIEQGAAYLYDNQSKEKTADEIYKILNFK